MTNHMCKYGRIRRINTAYTSIKPYSAYQLSPYRIRYGDVKFRRIRRINTIYNTVAFFLCAAKASSTRSRGSFLEGEKADPHLYC